MSRLTKFDWCCNRCCTCFHGLELCPAILGLAALSPRVDVIMWNSGSSAAGLAAAPVVRSSLAVRRCAQSNLRAGRNIAGEPVEYYRLRPVCLQESRSSGDLCYDGRGTFLPQRPGERSANGRPQLRSRGKTEAGSWRGFPEERHGALRSLALSPRAVGSALGGGGLGVSREPRGTANRNSPARRRAHAPASLRMSYTYVHHVSPFFCVSSPKSIVRSSGCVL